MEIKYRNQLNQGVGKYKTLSSYAGVGSIVSTTWGCFVMPSTVSNWEFVNVVEAAVARHMQNNPNDDLDYKQLSVVLGVGFVEDDRFVDYLRKTENMTNLKCLVAIPHMTLDKNNKCEVDRHPLNLMCQRQYPGHNLSEGIFTIPATFFPRWFFSPKDRKFRPLEEWQTIWRGRGLTDNSFAPPRDPNHSITRRVRGQDTEVYDKLTQTNMVFICPNGHISDIPWKEYFSAKANNEQNLREPGFDLFGYDNARCQCPNGGEHELRFLENRNKTESFGKLKCAKCGTYVSLEGIMNLQPKCSCEKPWEGIGRKDRECMQAGQPTSMKWAIVTSNSVYFAENFTSLFIPICYINAEAALSDVQRNVLALMRNRWYPRWRDKQNNNVTERDYVNAKGINNLIDYADNSGITITEEEMQAIVDVFCAPIPQEDDADIRESYRYAEFKVFHDNSKSLNNSDKLIFEDIILPNELTGYFDKIQCVSTLALSSTQINFARVQMPQATIGNDGRVTYPSSKKIFSGNAQDVTVMPALQTFGEGLFFSFNEEAVREWAMKNETLFNARYNKGNVDDMYRNMSEKMERGGKAKFYLLHTFSHILMKELEFSCGYASASLHERLYFSERMCGVLIYTADGSEGSMGGLVWQGQPDLIKATIYKALHRALDCSSDPICWENEDQLNHAACFSCAMVSETSCEERNQGLDRRTLVDEAFGFFKNLL